MSDKLKQSKVWFLNGAVVNQGCSSSNENSLEVMLIVPLVPLRLKKILEYVWENNLKANSTLRVKVLPIT